MINIHIILAVPVQFFKIQRVYVRGRDKGSSPLEKEIVCNRTAIEKMDKTVPHPSVTVNYPAEGTQG